MKNESVILVHGLWMFPWTMGKLTRGLRRAGYQTQDFGYSTTGRPFAENVDALVACINSRPEEVVHLVAHSMGGILCMRALPRVRKSGKLVMLGSPINGSSVARALHRRKWHKWLLKEATEPLINGVTEGQSLRPTAMLAGNMHWGVGRLVKHMDRASDGTVAVQETEADWIDAHRIIHTNHLGLLTNKKARKWVLHFLQHGNLDT